MKHQLWLLVVCAWPLLACGGPAGAPHEPEASAGSNTSAGGDSASGGDGGTPSESDARRSSWDVTGSVKADPTPLSFCEHIDFALTIDGGMLTIGHDGELFSSPVHMEDGAYVATSVDLPKGGCNTDRLLANELRLRGVDSDSDGAPDRLEGTATLDEVKVLGVDTFTFAKLNIDLTAELDQSEPTLIVPNAVLWTAWNPLDTLGLYASEPLTADSKLMLTSASSVSLPATASDPSIPGAVISFGTSLILPLSSTWRLSAEGKDLAGHALKVDDAIATFSTLVDPGVQEQDGFEGPSEAFGDQSLVTGYGTVPALSGARSLWLEAGAALLIHLRRSGNEKNLHFVARAFGTPSRDVYTPKDVRAGVIGGTEGVRLQLTTPASELTNATGGEKYPWAGDVMEFEGVLSEPGQDVLLSISNPPCYFGFPVCHAFAAWMIDDLKLE